MDSFLFSLLPRVVKLPREGIPWHYNSLCSTCQWQTGCKQRAETERTVSVIPDLNIEEAGFLRELIHLEQQDRHHLTDIEELVTLTRNLKPLEVKYPTTARRFRQILGMRRDSYVSPVLNAVESQSPQVIPCASDIAPGQSDLPSATC
jgi:hypothetical protein